MLETSRERVELLKAGINGKKIERLYIMCNNFKIVDSPLIWENVEPNIIKNKSSPIIQESVAELCS